MYMYIFLVLDFDHSIDFIIQMFQLQVSDARTDFLLLYVRSFQSTGLKLHSKPIKILPDALIYRPIILGY